MTKDTTCPISILVESRLLHQNQSSTPNQSQASSPNYKVKTQIQHVWVKLVLRLQIGLERIQQLSIIYIYVYLLYDHFQLSILYIHTCIQLYILLNMYVCIYLSIYIFIYLSTCIYIFIYLSICIFIYLSIYMCLFPLFIHAYVHRVFSGHNTILINPYDLEHNPLLWLTILSNVKGIYSILI